MINMKLNHLSIITALLLFELLPAAVSAQTKTIRRSTDHFEISFENRDLDSIKILQFSDLHLGSRRRLRDDLNTFKRIKKLVETHDPELIFITGDLFTGEKPYGDLLVSYTSFYFDQFNRPWFYTFGNHDAEGGFDRNSIYSVFSNSQWCVLGYHGSGKNKKYDYYTDLIVNENAPSWQIYGFDTGPHNGIKAVQPDQISWYKTVSEQTVNKYSSVINGVAIFHIPLIQYQFLLDDPEIEKQGVSLEKVYYEKNDGALYTAFTEMKNIKATFCGHDHYNNYWGKYTGDIILAYGYISGESTKEAWPTGGKLILLPVKGGEISIENVIPIFDREEHKY